MNSSNSENSAIGTARRRSFMVSVLAAFVLMNGLLFSWSVEKNEDGQIYSATYWNASDGQRYWGTAINLAEKGEFSIATANDEPLSRAGPLPALLFSLPIKWAGFEAAPFWIVSLQCALLAIMGWLAGEMTPGKRETKILAQLLVMFNPNLVGLAHHAQSDLIFSFFLAVMIFAGVRMIVQERDKVMPMFLLSGLAAGGLTLSRPAGQFFVVVFPIFVLVALAVHRKLSGVDLKRYLVGTILYLSVFAALVVPWAARNHAVLGDFGLSQSEAVMMRDQYRFLLKFTGVNPSDRSKAVRIAGRDYLLSRGADPTCPNRLKDPDCKSLMTKAYLSAIVDLPPLQIGQGLFSAWTTLYFGPATGRIADYVGIESSDLHVLLTKQFDGFSSYKHYLKFAIEEHGKYAILLILFSGFVLATRIFGTVGLLRSFVRRDLRGIGVLFLLTLGLFSAMYLFVGISRYRAPLEIMLMMLSAIGYQTVSERLRLRRWVGTSPRSDSK